MTSKAFELAQLSFGDNVKAEFGASSDLQIYHDGSNSYVRDNGTGTLTLQGSDQVKIQSPVTGENYAIFNDNGAVTLNYDNSLKFATNANGCKITSSDDANGLVVGHNDTDFAVYTDSTIGEIRLKAEDGSGNNFSKFMSFYTQPSGSSAAERMRIKSDGNVQINSQLHFTDTGSLIARPTTNALSFNTNGSERMRIDSSGNVGVGTTSPSSAIHAVGGAGTNIGIQSTAGSHWRLGDAVGASNGTFVIYDYTNSAARIAIESSGRQSNVGNVSGHLAKFENQHSTAPSILWLHMSGASPDSNSDYFVYAGDTTTARCIIWSDGDIDNHDNSYGGTSDQKLKQQITDASSQWDDIKALQVRKFKFNSDVEAGDSDEHWRLGVIAQEVESAGMSGLVNDRVDKDEDGNALETTTKSVKYSVLYMKAVKALQEAMDRIETLETKVAALESE